MKSSKYETKMIYKILNRRWKISDCVAWITNHGTSCLEHSCGNITYHTPCDMCFDVREALFVMKTRVLDVYKAKNDIIFM